MAAQRILIGRSRGARVAPGEHVMTGEHGDNAAQVRNRTQHGDEVLVPLVQAFSEPSTLGDVMA